MNQTLRVLIVDDSEDDAILLQHSLQRAGYEVTGEVVDTASAMRTALESQNWDVITSDHAMPRFSAPEALALAKELRPDVPFIIVSGEIDLNLAVGLMKGGAQDYIQKRELPRLAPAIKRELEDVELRRGKLRDEAALRESVLKYQSLIENSSDAIFCVDEKGQYQFVNQIFASNFGQNTDYFVGKTFREIFPKEDADSRYEILNRLFQTGESETFDIAVPVADKTLYFHSKLNPIKDETGKVVLGMSFSSDITDRKRMEEALRESEEKYRLLFNSGKDAIGIHRVAKNGQPTNLIEVNGAMCERLGYTREEMLKMSPQDIDAPEYLGQIHGVTEKLLVDKQALFETVHITKNGDRIPVEVSSVLLELEGGQAIMSIARDISQRKQAEEALRESENRFSLFMDYLPVIVFIKDKESRTLYVNKYMDNAVGASQWIGKTVFEIMPNEFGEKMVADDRETMKLGYQIIEEMIPHLDGKLHNYETQKFIIPREGQEPLLGGISLDITQRKQGEEALRVSEEKYRLLIENSHDIIYNIDKEGVFTFVSPAWTALLGHPVNEVTGQSFQKFVHADDIPRCIEWLQKVIESGTRQEGIEYRVRHIDSTWRWHTSSAVPVRDGSGNIVGFEGTARDISERKQAEETLIFQQIELKMQNEELLRSQAELEVARGRYFDLYDLAPVGYLTLDQNGLILEANLTAASLLEVGRAALVTRPLSHFIFKEDQDLYFLHRERLFETGDGQECELRMFKKDGSTFHAYLVAGVAKDENGAPVCRVVMTDISERKQTEDVLARTQQNYETFFNTIDEFLFVLDQQGNIIHTNSTVVERLGYTSKELFGKPVLMLHPPERREEAGRIVAEMLNGGTEFCPVPIVTKSGVQIPVETRVSHGFWDGKPVIFGVTKDIAKIKLSEEKFSKIFYVNPSACGLSDLDDRKYIEVNEAFYTLFGYDRDEVIGKTAFELGIIPVETANAILHKADLNGNVTNAEAKLKTKNGEIKHVLLSSENIYVQDKKYRYTVVHDISERKQAEDARREENNLLEKMVGFTEELLRTGSEQVPYQKIIENLLFISKAKYGAITLLNENSGKFTTVAVAGLNESLKQTVKILGFEPFGKEWNEYLNENETLNGAIVMHFSSLGELAGNVIPEKISRTIENQLNIGEVAVTKIRVNGQMFGDFTLIMPAGKNIDNEPFIELYSRQIDMFITRIQAEGEIIKTKEYFELMFNTSPELNLITRLSDRTIIDANEGFFAGTGYTREEVIDKSTHGLNLFKNPADRQRIYKKLLEEGYCKNEEALFQRKDGSVFTGSMSAKITLFNGVAHNFSSTRDISERKLAEEELISSVSLLNASLEATVDGILIVNRAGMITKWNQKFADMLGLPGALNTGKNDALVIDQILGRLSDPEQFLAKIKYLNSQPEESSFDQIKMKDGRVFERSSQPQRIGDEVVGRVWSFSDISKRKEAEEEIHKLNAELEQRVQGRTNQLEAINKELETFNYSVSHDLRAPLRRVMGFVEALRDDESNKQSGASLHLINNIRVSVERMNALIDALLGLARLSRAEIKRKTVDMSAVVHIVAAELQQSNPARQVEFVISEGIRANGDGQLLRIVMENLLGNAWKFTSRRDAAHIEFGAEPQADGSGAYFVRDDGVGFNMEYANKMFGAFQRLHSETDFPGIGIGLATVQRIIHRHGGRVWAESLPGKGATFYFTLAGD